MQHELRNYSVFQLLVFLIRAHILSSFIAGFIITSPFVFLYGLPVVLLMAWPTTVFLYRNGRHQDVTWAIWGTVISILYLAFLYSVVVPELDPDSWIIFVGGFYVIIPIAIAAGILTSVLTHKNIFDDIARKQESNFQSTPSPERFSKWFLWLTVVAIAVLGYFASEWFGVSLARTLSTGLIFAGSVTILVWRFVMKRKSQEDSSR